MSDAQAAPVPENGVPPAAQGPLIEEAPGFKVTVLSPHHQRSSITSFPGLHRKPCVLHHGGRAKGFLCPRAERHVRPPPRDPSSYSPFPSISVQVIKRGPKSAGYGFVAMSTAEAVQQAIESLADQELDGRPVIVEIAKPADQKDKEKKERRFRTKRRPGRRGSKPVPGEVTEAEANGDIVKQDDATAPAPETSEAAKPKKKKTRAKVCPSPIASDRFSSLPLPQRKSKRRAAPAEGDADAAPDAPGEPSAPEAFATDAPRAAPRRFYRRNYRPRQPRPVGEDPVGEPSKTMLFVANLGFNIDDEGLSALFTEAGINVLSARVVRRRWGHPRRSKGYGFVDVGSEEEQQKAIDALQGKEIGGRIIAVKIAVNTQRKDDADAPAA